MKSALKPDALTRFVDWSVGLVSPRRAVVRQHFRRMERDPEYRDGVFSLLRARGYRAARKGPNKTPWDGGPSSADAEIIPQNPVLRSRARELNRDDAIGSGACETFVREIIGTKLRPQSRAQAELAAAIEEVWVEREPTLTPSDPMPFGQWQRMVAKKLLEDGEVFVKRAVARPGEPVWFETVEAERVATPGDSYDAIDPSGEIRDGVEKDEDGRVVAFWVNRRHPGDWVQVVEYRKQDFVRVPAEAMRHVKLADRPGQTRGVTFFHAVLQDLRDLDLLMVASLKRVQVAACFALFIKSQQTVPDLLEVTADNYGYQLQEDIVPGGIFKLLPGESIETVTPNFPTPELEPFVIMLARRIGAALGVSWQAILRDWSQSNYSSARTQILADRPTTMILRLLLTEGVFDWIWQTVLEDAQLRGDRRLRGVTPKDLANVQWIGNARDWIDPLKEAHATQIKLELRVATLRDICAEQGKDWQEQIDQALLEEQYEAQRREELKLPPRVTAPANTSGASSAVADTEAQTEDAVVGANDGRGLRRVA
jgi:lambda family phage portal protein